MAAWIRDRVGGEVMEIESAGHIGDILRRYEQQDCIMGRW